MNAAPCFPPEFATATLPGLGGVWRSAGILQQLGLLPLYVDKVFERIRATHGEQPPASLLDEFALVRSALASCWRPYQRVPDASPPVHVFVGPPGAGKTTALCKWLTKAVLAQGRAARVWRLDGHAANFPGLLDVHAEVLGVAVEREWEPAQAAFDVGFVDLPGLDPRDAHALEPLRERLKKIGNAQVHLVLNAAYDVPVLLAHARAFAVLPVSDIIFTHFDEELRPIKLWNIVLRTNFTVRFLSRGQNIPGDFFAATPDFLIPRQIAG